MSETRRFIIVRGGDNELFEQLRSRFAGDLRTTIRYDRRTSARRTARQSMVMERRQGERRSPDYAKILATRGYFVIRAPWRRFRKPDQQATHGA